MKSNLSIKDLPVAKELEARDMAAVRGGANFAVVGGNTQAAIGGGFASPITQVAVGPTVIQGGDSFTSIKNQLANLTNTLGVMSTGLVQH